MKTKNMYQNTEKEKGMIAMKENNIFETNMRGTENKEEKGMFTMKKSTMMILMIFVLIGAAISVLILMDGTVSIPEAVGIFAYLAAVRIVGMLAKRGSKETPEEKKPASSLKALGNLSAQAYAPAHKPAA